MNLNLVEKKELQKAGVRITAVRILIWKTIKNKLSGTFSLADLGNELPTVDRSTLFRSLNVLSEAHLLHNIDDGSGSQKYCICNIDDKELKMRHVHFNCRLCHRTLCLTDVTLPKVELPNGFELEDVEYVVKGICADCSKKNHH